MKLEAHAKINWTLNITGKREDGYHLMDMVMQSISLYDDLEIHPRTDGRISLQVDGAPLAGDQSNLVYRSATLIKATYQVSQGADLRLTKRIPMGAGLGGGSADAAAAIHGLCDLWQLPLTDDEKARLGLQLGADVPYCLYGRPARVQGIGERIAPIQMARSFHLVLIQPCDALSTKEAFHYFDTRPAPQAADHDTALAAFAIGDMQALAASCRNVMQPASVQLRPAMQEALSALHNSGAFLSQMTGSGSVIFGAYASQEQAQRAHEQLKSHFPVCILCHTI